MLITITDSSRVRHALCALGEAGLRATAARRLVLEALAAASGPLTVSQVASGLDGRLPRSDLASVYRILDTFERVGISRRVHLGVGPVRYALQALDEPEYLLCERCGTTRAVDRRLLDDIRRQIELRFGLEPSFSSYPVAGVCRGCRRRGPAREVAT
jgi:Fur family transcriptional regulator, ferric uptake regulator